MTGWLDAVTASAVDGKPSAATVQGAATAGASLLTWARAMSAVEPAGMVLMRIRGPICGRSRDSASSATGPALVNGLISARAATTHSTEERNRDLY
jgi:hypothetical protein